MNKQLFPVGAWVLLAITLSIFHAQLARGCEISANGAARPKPDVAVIFLRVKASDEEPAKARGKLNEKTEKLKASATAAGVTLYLTEPVTSAATASDASDTSELAVQWALAEYAFGDKLSADENVAVVAKFVDAATSAGAEVTTLSDQSADPGAQVSPYSYVVSYPGGGLEALKQNFVLFSVRKPDAFIEQAIASGIARAKSAGEAIGKLIKDEPTGFDRIAVGATPVELSWRGFQAGLASATSEEVSIEVRVDAQVHFKHSDSTLGASGAGAHAHGRRAEKGIAATGRGSVNVPVERAIILARASASEKTVSESLAQLKTKIDGIGKQLTDAGLGDHDFATTGVAFLLGTSASPEGGWSSYMGEGAPKLKRFCYRDLTVTLPRREGESLADLQMRVKKVSAILEGKPQSEEADSDVAKMSRRFASMSGQSAGPEVFYVANRMEGLMTQMLESAFKEAKTQAGRVAAVTHQQLGEIRSLHPEGDITLSDFLSRLRMGRTRFSSTDTLQPNTLNNVLSRSLTVEFRTGAGEQTADGQHH